jgi:hypothetical protein
LRPARCAVRLQTKFCDVFVSRQHCAERRVCCQVFVSVGVQVRAALCVRAHRHLVQCVSPWCRGAALLAALRSRYVTLAALHHTFHSTIVTTCATSLLTCSDSAMLREQGQRARYRLPRTGVVREALAFKLLVQQQGGTARLLMQQHGLSLHEDSQSRNREAERNAAYILLYRESLVHRWS